MSSELEETELDLTGFMRSVFNKSAMPPFSFRVNLSQASYADKNNFLQSFILTGCNSLFDGEQLHNLTDRQIKKLREYLLSIGYDVDYNNINENKIVKVYNKDGSPYLKKLTDMRLNITFKDADPALNTYNSHIIPHSMF